jgi:hypothetical protein
VRICHNPKPRRFSREVDSPHEKVTTIRSQWAETVATSVVNPISVETTARRTSKNDTMINFISVIISYYQKGLKFIPTPTPPCFTEVFMFAERPTPGPKFSFNPTCTPPPKFPCICIVVGGVLTDIST